MDKKRFVFDLDNTLLTFDTDYQKQIFKEEFGDDNPFNENLYEYLVTYWTSYPKYVDTRLASLLSLCSGVHVEANFINKWIDSLREMPIAFEEGAEETLDYLTRKNKSVVLLTNWVWDCQVPRLKKAGIYHFFDRIYTGDYALKPHQNAYDAAMGFYSPSECIFVGDDLENDYIGPRKFGYDAVLYDRDDKYSNQFVKVKRINELKNKY